MSEKFALKWNDYQSNWNSSLSQLRKDSDFADVTLISDDKVKFSAHKVILSSCSNLFKFILKENSNANPLLYLCGVTSVNLDYILDYIYHGEVNLFQEQLDSFLESAQKLEIEGLIGQEGMANETHHENKIYKEEETVVPSAQAKQLVRMNDNKEVITRRQNRKPPNSDASKIDVTSFTSEEIKERIKELYQRIDGVSSCMVCDYTSTYGNNVKKHVEKHIDGLSYSCKLCNKEFRLIDSLNRHKSIVHRTKFSGPTIL